MMVAPSDEPESYRRRLRLYEADLTYKTTPPSERSAFTVVHDFAGFDKVLPREPSVLTTCLLRNNGVSDTSELDFKFRPRKVRTGHTL